MAEEVSVTTKREPFRLDWLIVLGLIALALVGFYIAVQRFLTTFWQAQTGAASVIVYDVNIANSTGTASNLFKTIPYIGVVITLVMVISVIIRTRRTTIEGCAILFSLFACPLFVCFAYFQFSIELSSDARTQRLASTSLNNSTYHLTFVPARSGNYHYRLYKCDSVEFLCFETYTSPLLETDVYSVNGFSLSNYPSSDTISIFYNNQVHYRYTEP